MVCEGNCERFIYKMVSIGSMNTQINLRLPQKLLVSARSYANKNGFGTVQELIKESLRERLFEPQISKEELELVRKLALVSREKNLFGTEKELFEKLRK